MRLDELTRPDFPILERRVNGQPLVYLDSAASSQKPRQVIEAMTRYYETSHSNVHRSIHTLGEEATELYESARDHVQRFLGAASREEIVFTRGTTDGLNLLAEAIGRTLRPGDEVLITEMKHHSNIIPWQMAVRDRGAVLKAVPWRFEPGTPPVAEAIGLAAAIEYLEKLGMSRVAEHERALTRDALDALSAIPDVTVYGPRNPEIKGAVVAFNVADLHPHDAAAF